MKILVSVKRVSDPDNANKVKIAPDASQVTSEGLEWKPNPYDDYAVETALRLNENAGKGNEKLGETVVVTVGPKDAAQTLRQTLAMGADRGVLIEGDDNQLDANMVAKALKAVVDKEQPDVVIMGMASVDGESAAVGPMLAEMLGWPMATLTSSIVTADEGKSFTVTRELDTGVATLKVTGPAILTVSDRILAPQAVKNGVTPADHAYPESDSGRYASLKGIMQAKKKKIDEMSLADVGAGDALSAYAGFELPPARGGAVTFVESAEELVAKLQTEAKVL